MKAPILVPLAAIAVLGAAAAAGEPAKAANLKDGIEAAKKSGKPLLLVTRWKTGICNSCDTWQGRVPKDPDVAAQLPRFEQAEWLYDGLNGKVIPWTREHGGTSEDPTVQAFVVEPDTLAVTRAPNATAYAPGEFAKWLKEAADAYEKSHPATKIAFAAAEVAVATEGTTTTWTCAALDEARAAGRAVLLYVGRGEREGADRSAKAEAAASRKMEKGVLDSESAAKAALGTTLLKLDLADAGHAAYAKTLGVEKAPALLLFVPGEAKPQALDAAITADALAFKLRKLAKK